MKKSAFAFIAFLALAGVTFGGVVLDYVVDTTVPTVSGYTAYKIQAIGIGVQTLSKFVINTPVYQAYAFDGASSFVQTEWEVKNDQLNPATTLYNKTNDSYVMFGDIRLPDLGGIVPLPPTFTPLPINTLEPNDGATQEGVGSLSNYTAGETSAWDSYLKTSVPDTTETTYDLFRLVLPSSVNIEQGGLDISLALYTATNYNPTSGAATITEYARGYDEGVQGVEELLWVWEQTSPPEFGDTDDDGDIDGIDLGNFASGWFGPDGAGSNGTSTAEASWFYGDFDDNGVVNGIDLGNFATGWFGPNGAGYTGGTASAVPEPGTIAMLILGALCLLGYRLRK